jgi:phytanoyl-CoA hydroxylase
MSVDAGDTDFMRHFAIDGYAAIRKFFAGKELSGLIENVDRYIRDVVPRMPSKEVFLEDRNDPATLKQIQRMGDHDPWFHQLLTSGRTRELAERILSGPVVPKNLQYFNKPPGIGKPTPPHQDGFYFMLNPCEAITMWVALDDVDEVNGCVRYVPGSHRRGMRRHARTETLGFSQGIVDYPTRQDQQGELAMRAAAGDLLVHDAMTIHRADGSRSASRSRRALGLVYYSHRAREDTEAHAAYQRKLTTQLKAQGRI